RSGQVVLAGGYDGEYGVVRLFEPKEVADLRPATSGVLFDVPTLGSPSRRGHFPGMAASVLRGVEQGRGEAERSSPRAAASVLRGVEQRRGGEGERSSPGAAASVLRGVEQGRGGEGERSSPGAAASVLRGVE